MIIGMNGDDEWCVSPTFVDHLGGPYIIILMVAFIFKIEISTSMFTAKYLI